MKDKILKKIKKGEIRMKPVWWWKLKGWFKKGTWVAVWLTIVVLAGIQSYLSKIRIKKEYWEFGEIGRELFWESVPWGWILVLGVSFGFLVFLWGKMGSNYRQENVKKIVINLLAIITGLVIFGLFLRMFELELGLRFI